MTEVTTCGESTPRDALFSADNPINDGPDFQRLPHNEGSSRFDALKKYYHSYLVAELLLSLSFLVVDLIFRIASPDPRQRRLPSQLLESTGDYVVNQAYSEEFVGETVSNVELYMYGSIVPFILQMLLSYVRGGRHDMHKTACVYATATGLTNLLTNFIKLYVGYLRPIFYDVCEPNDTYDYCTSGEDNGARVSFPSGHASAAFCGLGLFAFYLEQRFGLSTLHEWRLDAVSGHWWWVQTRPARFERIFSILCYMPFLLAGFIAASRVVDNKHFPADVVGGSLLGAATAKVVHGIWFSHE